MRLNIIERACSRVTLMPQAIVKQHRRFLENLKGLSAEDRGNWLLLGYCKYALVDWAAAISA